MPVFFYLLIIIFFSYFYNLFVFFFFFFSSRRRHTRCLSDWSSDVCSSDLYRARGCSLPSACIGLPATGSGTRDFMSGMGAIGVLISVSMAASTTVTAIPDRKSVV